MLLDKVLVAQGRKSQTLGEVAQNPDGTWHLGRLFAHLTGGGISSAEVMWMAGRLRHLMHVAGKSKEEARRIVAEEAKARPWEKRPG